MKKLPALLLVIAIHPTSVKACAVCFGQTDNPNIGRAYFWGIVILLGFTGSLLAAIVYTMYRIEVARKTPHPIP